MLKKLGEGKKNSFTTEQLLNSTFKNIGGESNLEVRKRMLEFFEYIISRHGGERIAVVSHGAAIKFFLQHFCEVDFTNETFGFESKVVCSTKLESPCVLRLVFDGREAIVVEKVKFGIS